ncbi:MAG: hypothetical protein ACRDIY_08195, partial [Chloroflexota bacterium]
QPLQRLDLEAELAPIFGSLSHAMGELFERYDAREIAAIQGFFNQTVRILREETARLQRGTTEGHSR